MRPVIRVYLYDEKGERFFGDGPLRLLHLVEQTGSLRSAAQTMGMAYTKALHLLRHAENVLGFALTRRQIGGRGGGGEGGYGEVRKLPGGMRACGQRALCAALSR